MWGVAFPLLGVLAGGVFLFYPQIICIGHVPLASPSIEHFSFLPSTYCPALSPGPLTLPSCSSYIPWEYEIPSGFSICSQGSECSKCSKPRGQGGGAKEDGEAIVVVVWHFLQGLPSHRGLIHLEGEI